MEPLEHRAEVVAPDLVGGHASARCVDDAHIGRASAVRVGLRFRWDLREIHFATRSGSTAGRVSRHGGEKPRSVPEG
jgi:hypothetical protein